MKYILRAGIIALALTLALTCGSSKKNALFPLLGATMNEGQGGPGVSPVTPSTNETPTTTTPAVVPVEVPSSPVNNGGGNSGGNPGGGNAANPGNTGDTGNTGNNGNNGNAGNTGDTGNAGNTGNTGNAVNNGNTGNTGDSGNAGNTGNTGNAGNTGNTGNNGGGAGSTDGNTAVDNGSGSAGNTSDEDDDKDEDVAIDDDEGDEDQSDIGGLGDDSSDEEKDNGAEKSCSSRSITLDSTTGNWYNTPAGNAKGRNGHGTNQSGIHTYWADQKLLLKVRNNCQAGWYRLRLVAKNYQGPLPSFYKYFNVSVRNESTGRYAGGMLIKASDQSYHRGILALYLPEGSTDLELVWTNDAYEENKYDANIQIKRAELKYLRRSRVTHSLNRAAYQYCDLTGRWFFDNKSAWTYWANQSLGFCYQDLRPGKYEVTLMVKNNGKLNKDYKEFDVMVAADGVADTVHISADDNRYNKGKVVLDLTGGDTQVNISWTNDMYVPDKYDANIQIRGIGLKRVGESKRSALSGYLYGTAAGRTILIGTVLTALLSLFGIYMWNRKRTMI